MSNHFYIVLRTAERLKKDQIQLWYRCIKQIGPNGIIGSEVVEAPNGLRNIVLSSRSELNGDTRSYIYEIPLIRHMEDSEVEKIISVWDTIYTQEYTIETGGLGEYIMAPHQLSAGAIMGNTDFYILCDTLTKFQHNSWIDDKISKGWRYGPELNMNEKTHPMLLPWNDLPEKYKKMDKRLPEEFFKTLKELGYIIIKQNDVDRYLNRKRVQKY